MMLFFRATLMVAILLSGLSFAGPTVDQNLPQGEGYDVVQAVCTSCHGEDVIVSLRYGEDEWNDVILRMIGSGLFLTDDEYVTVLKYLTNTLGSKGLTPDIADTSEKADNGHGGVSCPK